MRRLWSISGLARSACCFRLCVGFAHGGVSLFSHKAAVRCSVGFSRPPSWRLAYSGLPSQRHYRFSSHSWCLRLLSFEFDTVESSKLWCIQVVIKLSCQSAAQAARDSSQRTTYILELCSCATGYELLSCCISWTETCKLQNLSRWTRLPARESRRQGDIRPPVSRTFFSCDRLLPFLPGVISRVVSSKFGVASLTRSYAGCHADAGLQATVCNLA